MKVEKNTIKEDEYIDIINYLSKLWHSKITILKLVLIFGFVGVIVALSKPNEYVASSMFVPNSGGQTGGSGGLKSLASLAGINLGSAVDSRNNISPMLYGNITQSVTFKKKLLESPLKNLGDVKTLREYFEKDSETSSFSILATLKEYTIGLPAKIIRAFKGVQTEGSTDLVSGVEFVSESEMLYFEAIDNMLTLNINDREGYIEMICISDNPHLTAQVAKNGDSEGLPTVLLEGVNEEIPIIATNHAGIPELIKDSISGFICEEANYLSLAKKIKEFFAHQNLLSLTQIAKKKLIKDFDAHQQSQKLQNLFLNECKD